MAVCAALGINRKNIFRLAQATRQRRCPQTADRSGASPASRLRPSPDANPSGHQPQAVQRVMAKFNLRPPRRQVTCPRELIVLGKQRQITEIRILHFISLLDPSRP